MQCSASSNVLLYSIVLFPTALVYNWDLHIILVHSPLNSKSSTENTPVNFKLKWESEPYQQKQYWDCNSFWPYEVSFHLHFCEKASKKYQLFTIWH